MIIVGLIILAIYVFYLARIGHGFTELEEFTAKSELAKTRFSIIIPFRNEEKNLPDLLNSLKNIDYPINLFEVIFVDDSSQDKSTEIIKTALEQYGNNINFRMIHNERYSASPKKDAITQAVKIANYDWVLTTDADGMVADQWLKTYDAFIQKNNPTMVAGPIRYSSNRSLIDQFQQTEGLSLLSIAIGSFGLKQPLFCNGANLAYQKEAFDQVGGFEGNNHIASGDDVFMMEKMHKFYPGKIRFLKSKSALVITNPVASWRGIIEQRVRWASKTSAQNNWQVKTLGLTVFMMNLTMILSILACFLNPSLFYFYFTLILVKMIIDYTIIRLSSNFLFMTINPTVYVVNSLLYSFITVVVVLFSLRGSYRWKGRKFGEKA